MKVLSVLYFIVERVGLSIEPYYEKLLKFLPLLWNESENHNMLRCAVVGTLVHLIKVKRNYLLDKKNSFMNCYLS